MIERRCDVQHSVYVHANRALRPLDESRASLAGVSGPHYLQNGDGDMLSENHRQQRTGDQHPDVRSTSDDEESPPNTTAYPDLRQRLLGSTFHGLMGRPTRPSVRLHSPTQQKRVETPWAQRQPDCPSRDSSDLKGMAARNARRFIPTSCIPHTHRDIKKELVFSTAPKISSGKLGLAVESSDYRVTKQVRDPTETLQLHTHKAKSWIYHLVGSAADLGATTVMLFF